MEAKDYSKRTSRMYDDRDGDTITRLDGGLIKVCDGVAPKMAFFMVPCLKQPNDAVPSIDLMVEGYVRLAELSNDLKQRIKKELAPPGIYVAADGTEFAQSVPGCTIGGRPIKNS